MTSDQVKAIVAFGDELNTQLKKLAESNPYDRVGIYQAIIVLQTSLISYQMRGVLSGIGTVVDEAERIAKEGK